LDIERNFTLPDIEPFNAKQKNFKVNNKMTSITIRNTNVGEKIDLFSKSIYLCFKDKVECDIFRDNVDKNQRDFTKN